MEIQLTPAPPEMKSPVAPATAPATNPPSANWSLGDATGSRAGVLGAIANHPQMPQHWKDALTAEVNSYGPEFNHFELDSHYQKQGGRSNLHHTLIAYKVL